MGSTSVRGLLTLRQGLLLILLVPAVVIAVLAYRAQGTAAFERWGVWAQILGFPVAGLIAFVVLPSRRERDEALGAPMSGRLDDIEDELAAQVGAEEREQLARLLGTDQLDSVSIDVRFVRHVKRRRSAGGATEGRLSGIGDYYAGLTPGRLAIGWRGWRGQDGARTAPAGTPH